MPSCPSVCRLTFCQNGSSTSRTPRLAVALVPAPLSVNLCWSPFAACSLDRTREQKELKTHALVLGGSWQRLIRRPCPFCGEPAVEELEAPDRRIDGARGSATPLRPNPVHGTVSPTMTSKARGTSWRVYLGRVRNKFKKKRWKKRISRWAFGPVWAMELNKLAGVSCSAGFSRVSCDMLWWL